MPNPTINALIAQVNQTQEVIDSAVVLINGIADRIQVAVDAAIANGATAAELEPVALEITELRDRTDALSNAVAANTPAA